MIIPVKANADANVRCKWLCCLTCCFKSRETRVEEIRDVAIEALKTQSPISSVVREDRTLPSTPSVYFEQKSGQISPREKKDTQIIIVDMKHVEIHRERGEST